MTENEKLKTPVFDIHIHIQPWWMMKPQVYERMKLGHPAFDSLLVLAKNPQKFLQWMDAQGVEKAALINYVSPDIMGFTFDVNRFVSEFCTEAPDRLIPFGSINPRYSSDPAGEIHHLLYDFRIRGLKIHPPHMLFYPNDYQRGLKPLEILYHIASEERIPVMFHTGTSIFPGARSKFGDPMPLDDVATDFPNLILILAHGGRPIWMKTAFFLVRRHPNVYLDISGIPPKALLEYFPKLETIADKTLFGSDWPGPFVPGIRKNVDDFLALPLSSEAKGKILYHNAVKLFPS